MKGINTILSALLLLIVSNLFAQNKVKDSLTQLEEVVVTAQFSPRSEKNSIYKVKIITNKIIEAKAVNNLAELLRQELNMDFSNNQVFGAGVELNGVAKENIKIMIDGIPLVGRVNGVLNLNQIDLDNIQRIEVIEGPVSVFYGTDALGGTINLITKKTQHDILSGSLSGFYETVDAKELHVNVGIKQGKNTLKFGAGYYYFNGLSTDDTAVRVLNWPKKRNYNKNFKYGRDMGNLKLHFSSDFSEELLHTLGKLRFGKATDIDYITRRFDNSLNLQGKLKNNNFFDISVAYLNYDRFDISYKYKEIDQSVTLIDNNPNENGNYFDTFFTKAQFSNSANTKKINYVVGFEYEHDKGEGNRILDKTQQVAHTSIFTSINYKITNNFEIQPSIRYTNNSKFDNLWTPAFNLKYRINSSNVFRFSYGKGFRAPSIKELYLDWTPTFGPFTYTFSGNKNLKLESSQSCNLYYTFKKQLNNGASIVIEPSFAYNEIKDLIGLSNLVNFERHYINLNKMKSLNPVLNTRFSINDFKINVGLSYLGRYIEYTDTFNSDTFMFTPAISSSISYKIKPINVAVTMFYKYTGKRNGHFIEKENNIDVLRETTRDDFNNLDISLSKTFFNKKMSFSLGAKNIFNVTDIESFNQIGVAHERNIQLWGNSFFIKTKIKF